MGYFRNRLISDPLWFVEAVKWRILAFYGMVPPSIWATAGPQPYDWTDRAKLRDYLTITLKFWPLLAVSMIAVFATSDWRLYGFLCVLVLSNLVVVVFAGFAEPRLCYPVLLLHAMMALTVFMPGRKSQAVYMSPQPVPLAASGQGRRRGARTAAPCIGLGCLSLTMAVAVHETYGRSRAYREIDASYRAFESKAQIDGALPVITCSDGRLLIDGGPMKSIPVGSRGRAQLMTTASMFPPSWVGIQSGLPVSAAELRLPPFIYTYLRTAGKCNIAIPVRYVGVVGERPLTEGTTIDAELKLVGEGAISPSGLWFEAVRYHVVNAPPEVK
jgi:hypothetical protein